MHKVRWGILGPGTIAKQFASDMQFSKHAKIVAVASRNAKRATSFAETFSIPKVFNSYDGLYNAPDIDCIYIATPHNFHFEQAVACINSGKAVLCEKPLTTTPTECKELVELAQAKNIYLAEGMWSYFLPAIQKAKDWVDKGRVGKVLHVKCDFGYKQPKDESARWLNPKLAGGAMLDMGCYTLAMCNLFINEEIKHIHTVGKRASTGVDDDVSLLIEYKNASASLATSFRCKMHNWAFIIGEEGYMAIPDFWRAKEVHFYKNETLVEKFVDPRKGFGFNYEIDSVSTDILHGKSHSEIVTHATSIDLQRLIASVLATF